MEIVQIFYNRENKFQTNKYLVYRNFGYTNVKYRVNAIDNIPVVSSFDYMGIRYINTVRGKKHFGYLKKDEYLMLRKKYPSFKGKSKDNIKKIVKEFDKLNFFTSSAKRSFFYFLGKPNDIIEKELYVDSENPLCKTIWSWEYDGHDILNKINESQGTTSDCHALSSVYQEFYSYYAGLELENGEEVNKKVVADIAIFLDEILNDSNNAEFYQVLENNNLLPSLNFQNQYWSTEPDDVIYGNYFNSDFINYRDFLKHLYIEFKVFQDEIASPHTSPERAYFLFDFFDDYEALTFLTAQDKINVLKRIINSPITGYWTGVFIGTSFNRDALVWKLLESITVDQADDFLEGLLQQFQGIFDKDSLYEVMYEKMKSILSWSDVSKFMSALFKIWYNSSKYPYDVIGNVNDSIINPSVYNGKIPVIEYTSDQFLFFFRKNNYDFDFEENGSMIDIIEKVEAPAGSIASDIPDEESRGVYGLYQAITIKNNIENSFAMHYPILSIADKTSIAIPIFYLKYIDDSETVENWSTGVSLTLDVVLSFTGVSNLAKLRHLRHATRFGRIALGLETAAVGDAVIFYELATGAAGLIEFSASLMQIIVDHFVNYPTTICNPDSTDYDEDECEFYKKFNTILLILQIGSSTLDIVTSHQVRTRSRKLLEDATNESRLLNIDEDALLIVQRFANSLDEIKLVFQTKLANFYGSEWTETKLWTRLNEMSLEKQDAFVLDFQNSNKVELDILQDTYIADKLDDFNNPVLDIDGNTIPLQRTLMDDWENIEYLTRQRKDLKFLRNYSDIIYNYPLRDHVHKGVPRVNPRLNRVSQGRLAGSHNALIVRQPPPPPLLPGEIAWDTSTIGIEQNVLGYKQGVVQIDLSEIIDPATGMGFVKGDGTTIIKKGTEGEKNVYFPENYSTQRINEEMAYAHSQIDLNKPLTTKENKYFQTYTFTYLSRATDGHPIFIIYNSKFSASPFSASLGTIYPSQF